MRRMSKVWWALVVGVSLGVSVFWSTPAKATPLNIVGISSTHLTSPINPQLPSGFDFDPANIPTGDGIVLSQVYADPFNPGLYLYTYQIVHFFSSSENKITGISLEFFTNPTTLTVWVDTDGDGSADTLVTKPAFYILGSGILPDTPSASWTPGVPSGGTFSFADGDLEWLYKGEASVIFGTWSPLPPTTVVADVLNDGKTIASPTVYSPTPEPSLALLFSCGLGLFSFWRRRRSA